MKARTSELIALCALSATALLGGCASLQDVTAAQTGCQSSEITIVEDHVGWSSRNWVAQCRGRRYQCASISTGRNSSQINCTPEEGPAAVATASTSPTPTAPTEPTVERMVGNDGAHEFVVLRTRFDVGGHRIALATAPTQRPSHAVLTISAPLRALADGCRAGIMIDGQISPLTASSSEVVAGRREYRYEIEMALVRQMASAERVVGRICDAEWRLEDREQGWVRELLARVDEELAWAGQQTSGGESAAP